MTTTGRKEEDTRRDEQLTGHRQCSEVAAGQTETNEFSC